jgi:hypothetical protein
MGGRRDGEDGKRRQGERFVGYEMLALTGVDSRVD